MVSFKEAFDANITVEAEFIHENDILAFYINNDKGELIGYSSIDDEQIAILIGRILMAKESQIFKVCGFSSVDMLKVKNGNAVGNKKERLF